MKKISIILVFALFSCSPQKENVGYVLEDDVSSQNIPQETHANDVLELLGSPTFSSDFDGTRWYYVSAKTEKYAFLKPSVSERQTIVISFDDQGIVSAFQKLSLEEGKEISFESDKTRTHGRDLNLLEEIFGNLGKFNKAADTMQ